MAKLHLRLGHEILSLANKASKTGEPIARPLESNYSNQGYLKCHDQFMLGDRILVASVVQKGCYKRKIIFPGGKWKNEQTGVIIGGPVEKLVYTPIGFGFGFDSQNK